MNKPKLLVSFSGGRTSAFMLRLIWDAWRDRYEIIVVFANTGKEAAGTLDFVHYVSVMWQIPIVWVEYWPNPEKHGGAPLASVEHLVTDYYNASRNGEPYERLISVKGIPSSAAPFCTTYLKNYTIRAYARAIVWEKYYTAIGMRADEARVNKRWEKERLIYPLKTGEWPSFGNFDKQDVLLFWEDHAFDLEIHPDDGNCDNCWKKDFRVLIRNAKRNPEGFEWWRNVHLTYGHFNPRGNDMKPPYNMYRGGLSVDDIFMLADNDNEAYLEALAKRRLKDACGESCEAFGDDTNTIDFDDLD